MSSLFKEKIAPYLMALAAVLIWHVLDARIPDNDNFIGSSLTLGAILTGFLATAKAILMTLDSPVMQRLRETSYIHDLVSYLAQAIWLSFSFCIVSISGYFIDENSIWYGHLWVFFGVASASSFMLVNNLILKIIKHSPFK